MPPSAVYRDLLVLWSQAVVIDIASSIVFLLQSSEPKAGEKRKHNEDSDSDPEPEDDVK